MQQEQLISEAGMTSYPRNVLLSIQKYCFLKELYRLYGLKKCHIKTLVTVF